MATSVATFWSCILLTHLYLYLLFIDL
jgi:hypothetical protein